MTTMEILKRHLSDKNYFIVGNAVKALENRHLLNDVIRAMEEYARQKINEYVINENASTVGSDFNIGDIVQFVDTRNEWQKEKGHGMGHGIRVSFAFRKQYEILGFTKNGHIKINPGGGITYYAKTRFKKIFQQTELSTIKEHTTIIPAEDTQKILQKSLSIPVHYNYGGTNV